MQSHLFCRGDLGFMPLIGGGAETEKQPRNAPRRAARPFFFDRGGQLLSPYESRTDEIRERRGELAIDGDRIPVISNERLSGNPDASGFDSKLIAERIHQALPDGKILICIREQRTMILSWYFEYLRRGGTHGLGRYISQQYDGGRPAFSLAHFRYDALIDHYQTLFGKSNVVVLPFEMLAEEAARFVAAITDFAGVPRTDDLPFDIRQNSPNLRHRAARYRLRALGAFVRSDSSNGHSVYAREPACMIAKTMRRALAGLYTVKSAQATVDGLAGQVEALVEDYYCPSNSRTAELTGLPLKEQYGYR